MNEKNPHIPTEALEGKSKSQAETKHKMTIESRPATIKPDVEAIAKRDAAARVEARIQAGSDLKAIKSSLEEQIKVGDDLVESLEDDHPNLKSAVELRRNDLLQLAYVQEKLEKGGMSAEITFKPHAYENISMMDRQPPAITSRHKKKVAIQPIAVRGETTKESTFQKNAEFVIDKLVGWLKTKFAPKEKLPTPMTAYDREHGMRKEAAMASKATEAAMLKKRATIEREISSDPAVVRLERILSTAKLEGNRKRYQAQLVALKTRLRQELSAPGDRAALAFEAQMSGEVTPEMRKAAERIGTELLDLAERPVGVPDEMDRRLDFHNREHSEGVAQRTEEILRAMREGGVAISNREMQIGRLAAKGHDTVQRGLIEDGRFKRNRDANERASADLLVQKMRETGLFSEAETTLAWNAIYDGTTPDEKLADNTVVQARLSRESHPVVRTLALADLGEAGTNPEDFLRGGDALFREENLDMHDLDLWKLTDDKKEAYRQRLLGWTKFQPLFARGRQVRFENELGDLLESAKKNLRRLFSRFDESVALAEERARRREGMSFEELCEDMGFKFAEAETEAVAK